MSDGTGIEWTDATWGPVTGCTPVSSGCERCYARRMAKRLAGRFGYPADDPFRVTLHPDRLDEPLHRRKPSRIFVDSMGDLFHPDVPEEFIDRVFATMALAKQHTFQVLTKRPKRMLAYLSGMKCWEAPESPIVDRFVSLPRLEVTADSWPLPNVWLGVSVEDQARADERIPILLQTPAAVRFVSLESLLGPVDLSRWINASWWEEAETVQILSWGQPTGMSRPGRTGWHPASKGLFGLDWLIVGAETGPGARPCNPEWVESIIGQARAADIPIFLKDNLGLPQRIQVQEYPQTGGNRDA